MLPRSFRITAVVCIMLAATLAGCSDNETPGVTTPTVATSSNGGSSSPPVVPTVPQPAAELGIGKVSVTGATASWTVLHGTDDTESYLEYGPDGVFAQQTQRFFGVGQKTTRLDGLVGGTSYDFRVVVIDDDELTRSTARSFTTLGASGQVQEPSAGGEASIYTIRDLNIGEIYPTAAVVSWTVTGIAGTVSHAEFGTTTDYDHFTQDQVGPGRVNALLNGLSAGTEYHFRVVARQGDSPLQTQDIVFRTPFPDDAEPYLPPTVLGIPDVADDTLPPDVTAVSDTGASTSTLIRWTVTDPENSAFTLSWVEYTVNGGPILRTPTQSGDGDRFATIEGLPPNAEVIYTVIARDPAFGTSPGEHSDADGPHTATSGNPAPADIVPPVIDCAVNPTSAIPPPPAPVVTEISPVTAKIRWKVQEPNAVLSKVEYGQNGVFDGATTAQTSNGVHKSLLVGLKADSDYQVRIVAVDGSGNQAICGPVSFHTLPRPSISNVHVSDIRLNRFTVSWDFTGPAGAMNYVSYGKNPPPVGCVQLSCLAPYNTPTQYADPTVPPTTHGVWHMKQVIAYLDNPTIPLSSATAYNVVIRGYGATGTATLTPPILAPTAQLVEITIRGNKTEDDLPFGDGAPKTTIPGIIYVDNTYPIVFKLYNVGDVVHAWQLDSTSLTGPATPWVAPPMVPVTGDHQFTVPVFLYPGLYPMQDPRHSLDMTGTMSVTGVPQPYWP